MPASDLNSWGRKSKKGKAKASDYKPNTGLKRKCGQKSMSVTPSINGDDDKELEMQKLCKTKATNGKLPMSIREQMKEGSGCDLFYEFLDKQDYPDYYHLITQPIALSHLQKWANSNHYKMVQAFEDDWKLIFNNAWTYNVSFVGIVISNNKLTVKDLFMQMGFSLPLSLNPLVPWF
ncbi:hypothetical protein H0H87_003135 [Tephrocybe sp. NHM501043]|nr:hypothetical protein H0H87_003135 [Tephrocybe sp. NHM501043]